MNYFRSLFVKSVVDKVGSPEAQVNKMFLSMYINICLILNTIFPEHSAADNLFLGLILFPIGIRYYQNKDFPMLGSQFIIGGGAIVIGMSLESTFEKIIIAITQYSGISFLISTLMSIILSVGLIKLGLGEKSSRYIGQLMNNKVFLWIYFGSIIGLMSLFLFCDLSAR